MKISKTVGKFIVTINQLFKKVLDFIILKTVFEQQFKSKKSNYNR